MNVQELKTYMEHICKLEGSIYAMQSIRNNLNWKIRSLRNYSGEPEFAEEYVEDIDWSDEFENIKAYCGAGAGLGGIIGLIALLCGYKPHYAFGYLRTIFV